MSRPLLLDLFCGAGGAAMGYHRAGFDVVGFDINPQPDYPFRFHQIDVLNLTPLSVAGYDAVHASPPCQSYSAMSNRWGSEHPELIARVRDLISDRPYVIENVAGARKHMVDPIELTGEMFGLPVHRPRLFELGGWYTIAPSKPQRGKDLVAVYGKPDGRRLITRADGSEYRAWASVEEGQQALGVDWTDDWHQLREAIPPAYTEWIGTQLLDTLNKRSLV